MLVAGVVTHVAVFGAQAASVVNASFSGGTGTALVGDTLYARTGSSLTLTVETDAVANCIVLSGAHSGFSTSPSTSSATSKTWDFALIATNGGDGTKTTDVAAYDDPGCSGNPATASASYAVDNTAPTVTASIPQSPNLANWYNVQVSITWSAVDTGSGVASGPTPATDAQTADVSSVTKQSTATDRVGNTGSGQVTLKVDRTAPTIVGGRAPAANANGWNNSPVTVSFTCSDARSGVRTCARPTTLNGDGAGQAVVGSAVDFADNGSSATVVVNIDTAVPALSGAPVGSPNAAGWFNDDVVVDWTCDDGAGAGFLAAECSDTVIAKEGVALSETRSVTDLAGNSSAAAASAPAVNIDWTQPVTTAGAVPAWSNGPVTLVLEATDTLSGVERTHFSVDGGPTRTYDSSAPPTFSDDGVYSVEFWSVDYAGNRETRQLVQVGVDATGPTLATRTSPSANPGGWNNDDVVVHFSCQDDVSGVAGCPADVTVTEEGADQEISGTASDNAGNVSRAAATVSIDRTPPVVVVTGVVDGGTYEQGAIEAGCSTSDRLSGVAKDATLGITGGPVGAVTLTCAGAVDRAGNTRAPVSVTVSVTSAAQFEFGGFQAPINGDGTNKAKAGSTVPVKFSLGGNFGEDVLVGDHPVSTAAGCSTTARSGGRATPTMSVNGGDLSYDRASDTYSYPWKTDKSWSGCRQLELAFVDGSTATALFDFR